MDAVSVTAAAGFIAAGVAAGIKPDGVPDLAVVACPGGAVAAAVFTTNRAAAAPVALSRRHLAAGPGVTAVVLNSGCANAATGPEGMEAAEAMAHAAATLLECPPEEILVCSTGPIGTPLPVDRVTEGIGSAVAVLAATEEGAVGAADAILTTDSRAKGTVQAGYAFVVGGMAKGAGMIRPDMATMLAVLTTDAIVEPDHLQQALMDAVDASFHALDVDGCPSTNDSVIVLASGASGVAPEVGELTDVLAAACLDLARQIAADAEGASRVVTLEVSGAADTATARALGRAVADSALVRASLYGGDPNWGRIVAALGATHLPYDPEAVAVSFAGVPVAGRGARLAYDDDALGATIATGDFTVGISVGDGPGSAAVLTCDLTPAYAVLNGERS